MSYILYFKNYTIQIFIKNKVTKQWQVIIGEKYFGLR